MNKGLTDLFITLGKEKLVSQLSKNWTANTFKGFASFEEFYKKSASDELVAFKEKIFDICVKFDVKPNDLIGYIKMELEDAYDKINER